MSLVLWPILYAMYWENCHCWNLQNINKITLPYGHTVGVSQLELKSLTDSSQTVMPAYIGMVWEHFCNGAIPIFHDICPTFPRHQSTYLPTSTYLVVGIVQCLLSFRYLFCISPYSLLLLGSFFYPFVFLILMWNRIYLSLVIGIIFFLMLACKHCLFSSFSSCYLSQLCNSHRFEISTICLPLHVKR